MFFLSIAQHYLLWHYSRAYLEIFHVWLNFLWFVIHYFSMPQLFRSWFAPWKRITEERGNTWNVEDFAGFILIGLLSRLIGFILRSTVLALGLITLLLTICIGFVTYIFWLSAPLFIIILFGTGVTLLFS
jgi:hypothetical protein